MTDGKNLAATATRGVRGNSKADSMPGRIAPDALGFTDLSRPSRSLRRPGPPRP
ncbi:MAG: hypothetical protein U0838_05680 [Chloroflexota bacterium]